MYKPKENTKTLSKNIFEMNLVWVQILNVTIQITAVYLNNINSYIVRPTSQKLLLIPEEFIVPRPKMYKENMVIIMDSTIASAVQKA